MAGEAEVGDPFTTLFSNLTPTLQSLARGLFDDESQPGKAVWRNLTYVYQGFGRLAQTLDEVLPSNVAPVEPLVTVLAGRTLGPIDGASASAPADAPPSAVLRVGLMVSAQASNCSDVSLSVAGLAPARAYRFNVDVINSTLTMSSVLAGVTQATGADQAIALHFPLAPPAVAFVTLDLVQ